MEIHIVKYTTFIDTYVEKQVEKDKLFIVLITFLVLKKADWAIKWINDKDLLATRLVAFACVEGIFQVHSVQFIGQETWYDARFSVFHQLISR